MHVLIFTNAWTDVHARTHTHTPTYNQYSTAKRQQPMQLYDFRNHIQLIGASPTKMLQRRIPTPTYVYRYSRHSNLNAMLNISASNLLRTHV